MQHQLKGLDDVCVLSDVVQQAHLANGRHSTSRSAGYNSERKACCLGYARCRQGDSASRGCHARPEHMHGAINTHILDDEYASPPLCRAPRHHASSGSRSWDLRCKACRPLLQTLHCLPQSLPHHPWPCCPQPRMQHSQQCALPWTAGSRCQCLPQRIQQHQHQLRALSLHHQHPVGRLQRTQMALHPRPCAHCCWMALCWPAFCWICSSQQWWVLTLSFV